APGEQRDITFTIDKSMLSYYDDSKGEWVVEPGRFEALVGASAGDIKSKVAFEVR
ncbi:MAG: fibronectin type III-like domain-contianing protein, partial [Prevotellaceae bacterium]|nr:fibronectin type III-like domain-contianing protein [Prevotellaceae bacterium]